MEKFHILEVRKGTPGFREVEGISLSIGGEVPVFEATQSGRIYDAVTGARLEAFTYAGRTPLSRSMYALQQNGVLWWRDNQMAFSAKYGRPPEVIEIIRESQGPGEIQTCSRETHCGHR